jgi:uncharacterized membrane protein (UPF0127 family)
VTSRRDRRAARRPPYLAISAVVAVVLLVGAVVAVRVLDGGGSGPVAGALDAALARSTPAEAPFEGLTEVELLLDGECRRVAVADEPAETGSGLRGIPDPGPYAGMLFVYPEPKVASFTMSGVTFPLEIGFYDVDGEPVRRTHMVPCPESIADCPGYSSEREMLYALETYDGDTPAGALGGCPA